jgi:hypothetical protein
MKNQLKTRLFLFLFSLVMFTNCKKSDELNPANIADKISGNYTMTFISANGQSLNLPFNQNGNQANGTITISKVSTTTISFSLTLITIVNGVKSQDADSDNFDIKQNGSVIELYEINSTTKVGALSGTILTIDSGGTKINANRN